MDRYSFVKVQKPSGWSISRILSNEQSPSVQSSLWAVRRRAARCSLPGAGLSHKRERHVWRRAVSHRPRTKSPLLGLAPDGGYLAACITANAGGLLHHLFTITHLRGLFVSVALLSGRFTPLGGFPTPGYSPTSCFMECGLSSIPSTQDRDCPTSLKYLASYTHE